MSRRPLAVAGAAAGVLVAVGAALALAWRGLRLEVSASAPGVALGTGIVLAAAVLAGTALVARGRRRTAAALAAERERDRQRERLAHRRFVQRLDHELKNPLTALRAAAAALEPSADDPRLVGAHATVLSQAGRLSGLVGDLRKLAELETQPIDVVPVDLAAVVADVVADVGEQSAATVDAAPRVEVSMPTVPWPLPQVLGDADLLYLAVYNLVANAVKFCPPGAPVEVRGSDEGATVVLEVADGGPGIPADEVDLVLEELARGRDARGTPGSGLGLALARVVAARHGGSLVLRSRHGSGTVVRLTLPAAPRPAA